MAAARSTFVLAPTCSRVLIVGERSRGPGPWIASEPPPPGGVFFVFFFWGIGTGPPANPSNAESIHCADSRGVPRTFMGASAPMRCGLSTAAASNEEFDSLVSKPYLTGLWSAGQA